MTLQPILTVDLTAGEIGQFNVPAEWERDYLGGASLAARMLYDELTPELDPLLPEAPLLFLNGPLSGTAGPAVGRFVTCGKSPATGLWAESNCGGFWGPELRKAGFDGVLIHGRAEKPVYIWIKDDEVELRTAENIWGIETYQVQEMILKELNVNGARVATIGPAGERQIPFALILTDHGRVAGRTGMGAVMGSKNLKAVAVKGTATVPVLDAKAFAPVRSKANRDLREDSVTSALRELGSASASDYFDYLGESSKKGFSRGSMEGFERVSGSSFSESLLVGVSACHACVIACGRVVALSEGDKRKGPEYETIMGFGPNLWIDDKDFITRMGELCDRYGMDVISLSNTIGLAFTLFELGVIAEGDIGGMKLQWGDMETVEKLIHMTARQEGFGAQLAEGARALGQQYAAEERAIQVNGLEVAYHDPRGASGMALVYATSPRGACHNQSDYFLVDIGQVETELGMEFFDRQAGAEKATNVARHQDWRTVFNALVICFFANVAPQTVVDLINPACGLDWKIEDMLLAGERAWNLKRVINNRLGISKENDRLPKPLLDPLPDGGSEGYIIDLDAMLKVYYEAREWDPDTGFPTQKKLKELGLDWVADDLKEL
ncbi:MAG: aldehyde ferredoxin oxidoreductase [Chloroflexi bacterium]|nr:MAG: aldehyde ferredoxin oxidoreductase [Chloroflexota bacterium]MBL1193542.1 aldehyde ferredoxin oxidoreductase [Chloroflexota bacterium]NOH10833.1 aldehyde ferredoxin oxidoreductase family protein [Chloroflexota bacterium]